jgi:two-component system nitrate/nitrite response regulator NarL
VVIRLVLADDHPIVLDGLAQLFASDPDCEVVARVTDGEQALKAVREHKPDILVLDLRMPVKDGVTVLRELRNEALPTQVVLLTAVESDDLFDAIRLGARGVVLKDMASKLLLDAIRNVHAGGTWIERNTAGAALDRLHGHDSQKSGALSTLTSRELEVARLTAQGLPNKTVADRLGITEGTAKLHLHHVYEKLGIDGRMALVRYLQGYGAI